MGNDFCFRCGGNLLIKEVLNDVVSCECENCQQGYVKEKGKSLLECRGLSSFSIPLYLIIFERNVVSNERVSEIALAIAHHNHIKWIGIVIEDIEEELKNPKLVLVEKLNLNVTEELVRNYLSRLLLELKKHLDIEIRT